MLTIRNEVVLHDPLMVFHDIGLYGSAGRILCWFETKTLLDQPAGRLVQIDAAARSRDEAPADLAVDRHGIAD